MSTPLPAAFSLDALRADIARLLHEDPSEIGDEDSLIDLGLDSVSYTHLTLPTKA